MKIHTVCSAFLVGSQTQSSLGPRDYLASRVSDALWGVVLSPLSLPPYPPLQLTQGCSEDLGNNKACVRVNPLLATVHSVHCQRMGENSPMAKEQAGET